ncbi:hypothetical protein MVEN_00876200 [Mycena venus]|uniref:Glycoside hydrolase family 78 protein n=1 Tax=Mycena venus TaxID=2733690 RepID=A0A8H7D446_9AGAR|nr:hypothetical protein MVEN_00876200 [Mycena venus]
MAPTFIYALLCLAAAKLPLFSGLAVVAAVEAANVPALARSVAQPKLNFEASNWIWNSGSMSAAFRKDFAPPSGKSLIAADMIITAVMGFNLYVNGDYIGSQSAYNHSEYAQRFCIDLQPGFNVFAVNATTATSNVGGILATILVTYQDGTTDILVTDSSWRMTNGSPVGFEQLSFDDNIWSTATVTAAYTGAQKTVLFPADSPNMTLSTAQWIWTDVIPANGNLPPGSRAFRKTFTPAPGQIPMSANILISTDDIYTLYVNGATIGNGTNWEVVQHYVVNFATPVSKIVLAVNATNVGTSPNPAGVLVVMEVNMQPKGRTSCIAGSIISSDFSWSSTLDRIPTKFQQPDFDDSTWLGVATQGAYGVLPWTGGLSIAAASAPITV